LAPSVKSIIKEDRLRFKQPNALALVARISAIAAGAEFMAFAAE
jgi:hypothetical protein